MAEEVSSLLLRVGVDFDALEAFVQTLPEVVSVAEGVGAALNATQVGNPELFRAKGEALSRALITGLQAGALGLEFAGGSIAQQITNRVFGELDQATAQRYVRDVQRLLDQVQLSVPQLTAPLVNQQSLQGLGQVAQLASGARRELEAMSGALDTVVARIAALSSVSLPKMLVRRTADRTGLELTPGARRVAETIGISPDPSQRPNNVAGSSAAVGMDLIRARNQVRRELAVEQEQIQRVIANGQRLLEASTRAPAISGPGRDNQLDLLTQALSGPAKQVEAAGQRLARATEAAAREAERAALNAQRDNDRIAGRVQGPGGAQANALAEPLSTEYLTKFVSQAEIMAARIDPILGSITDSIRQHGIQQAVTLEVAKDGLARIADGHHRILAAKALGIQVPTVIQRSSLTTFADGVPLASFTNPLVRGLSLNSLPELFSPSQAFGPRPTPRLDTITAEGELFSRQEAVTQAAQTRGQVDIFEAIQQTLTRSDALLAAAAGATSSADAANRVVAEAARLNALNAITRGPDGGRPVGLLSPEERAEVARRAQAPGGFSGIQLRDEREKAGLYQAPVSRPPEQLALTRGLGLGAFDFTDRLDRIFARLGDRVGFGPQGELAARTTVVPGTGQPIAPRFDRSAIDRMSDADLRTLAALRTSDFGPAPRGNGPKIYDVPDEYEFKSNSRGQQSAIDKLNTRVQTRNTIREAERDARQAEIDFDRQPLANLAFAELQSREQRAAIKAKNDARRAAGIPTDAERAQQEYDARERKRLQEMAFRPLLENLRGTQTFDERLASKERQRAFRTPRGAGPAPDYEGALRALQQMENGPLNPVGGIPGVGLPRGGVTSPAIPPPSAAVPAPLAAPRFASNVDTIAFAAGRSGRSVEEALQQLRALELLNGNQVRTNSVREQVGSRVAEGATFRTQQDARDAERRAALAENTRLQALAAGSPQAVFQAQVGQANAERTYLANVRASQRLDEALARLAVQIEATARAADLGGQSALRSIGNVPQGLSSLLGITAPSTRGFGLGSTLDPRLQDAVAGLPGGSSLSLAGGGIIGSQSRVVQALQQSAAQQQVAASVQQQAASTQASAAVLQAGGAGGRAGGGGGPGGGGPGGGGGGGNGPFPGPGQPFGNGGRQSAFGQARQFVRNQFSDQDTFLGGIRQGFSGGDDGGPGFFGRSVGSAARFSLVYGAAYSALRLFTTAFGEGIQGAIAFETALTDLNIATERTGRSNEGFAFELSNLGAGRGFAPGESVAAGARAVGLFGATDSSRAEQEQIATVSTDVATKIAFISGQTLEQVQTQLAGITRSFNVDPLQQERIFDVASFVGRRTGRPAGELLQSLGQIGSLGGDAGFSLEQTAAIIARLTSTTGQTPQAVSGFLSQVLSRADDPRLQQKLRAVGVNTEGTTLAQQIEELSGLDLPQSAKNQIVSGFGRGRSGQALGIILEQFPEIQALASGAEGAQGLGDKDFQQAVNTVGGQLRVLGSSLTDLFTGLASTGILDVFVLLLSAAQGLVEALDAVVDVFNLIPREARSVAFMLLEVYGALLLLSKIGPVANAISRAGLGTLVVPAATSRGATRAAAAAQAAQAAAQRTAAAAASASATATTTAATAAAATGAAAGPAQQRAAAAAARLTAAQAAAATAAATAATTAAAAQRAMDPSVLAGSRAERARATGLLLAGGARTGVVRAATALGNTPLGTRLPGVGIAARGLSLIPGITATGGAALAGGLIAGAGAAAALVGVGIWKAFAQAAKSEEDILTARQSVFGASTKEDFDAAKSDLDKARKTAEERDDFKLLSSDSLTLGIANFIDDIRGVGGKQKGEIEALEAERVKREKTVEEARTKAIDTSPGAVFEGFVAGPESVSQGLALMTERGFTATRQLAALNQAFDAVASKSSMAAGNLAVVFAGQFDAFNIEANSSLTNSGNEFSGKLAEGSPRLSGGRLRENVLEQGPFGLVAAPFTALAGGAGRAAGADGILGRLKAFSDGTDDALRETLNEFNPFRENDRERDERTRRGADEIDRVLGDPAVQEELGGVINDVLRGNGKDPALGPVVITKDDRDEITERRKKILESKLGKPFDKLDQSDKDRFYAELDKSFEDTLAAFNGTKVTAETAAAFIQGVRQTAPAAGEELALTSGDQLAGASLTTNAFKDARAKAQATLTDSQASDEDKLAAIRLMELIDLDILRAAQNEVAKRNARIDALAGLASARLGNDPLQGALINIGAIQAKLAATTDQDERTALEAALETEGRTFRRAQVASRSASDKAGIDPRDAVGNAGAGVRDAQRQLAIAIPGTEEYYKSVRALIEAQVAFADAQVNSDLQVTLSKLSVQDTVGRATAELEAAKQRRANLDKGFTATGLNDFDTEGNQVGTVDLKGKGKGIGQQVIDGLLSNNYTGAGANAARAIISAFTATTAEKASELAQNGAYQPGVSLGPAPTNVQNASGLPLAVLQGKQAYVDGTGASIFPGFTPEQIRKAQEAYRKEQADYQAQVAASTQTFGSPGTAVLPGRQGQVLTGGSFATSGVLAPKPGQLTLGNRSLIDLITGSGAAFGKLDGNIVPRRTADGGISSHSFGNALDIFGTEAELDALVKQLTPLAGKGLKELIFTGKEGPGTYLGKGGRTFKPSANVVNNHRDHIHAQVDDPAAIQAAAKAAGINVQVRSSGDLAGEKAAADEEVKRRERERVLAIQARDIAKLNSTLDPRNSLDRARADLQIANRILRDASGDKGSQEYYQALTGVKQAQVGLARAEADRAYAQDRAGAIQAQSPLAAAASALRIATDRLKNEVPRTKEYYEAQADLYRAQQDFAEATRQAQATALRLASDITDPVAQAAIDLRTAKAKADQVRRNGGDKDAQNAADLEVKQAATTLEQSVFDQRLNRARTDAELGRTSQSAYIDFLKSEEARLGAIKNRTEQQQAQYDQIQRELLNVNKQLSGQFNIGDIQMPSVYDARRLMTEQQRQEKERDDALRSISGPFKRIRNARPFSPDNVGGGVDLRDQSQIDAAGASITNDLATTSVVNNFAGQNNAISIVVNGSNLEEVKNLLSQYLGAGAFQRSTVSTAKV